MCCAGWVRHSGCSIVGFVGFRVLFRVCSFGVECQYCDFHGVCIEFLLQVILFYLLVFLGGLLVLHM